MYAIYVAISRIIQNVILTIKVYCTLLDGPLLISDLFIVDSSVKASRYREKIKQKLRNNCFAGKYFCLDSDRRLIG